MFSPQAPSFTRGSAASLLTVSAIERRIVLNLAESAGRKPAELELELRSADLDLPVEAHEVRCVLRQLEEEFEVRLTEGKVPLSYVRDLAVFIQAQMLAHRV